MINLPLAPAPLPGLIIHLMTDDPKGLTINGPPISVTVPYLALATCVYYLRWACTN